MSNDRPAAFRVLPTSVVDPLGKRTSNAYDANGNLVDRTDPNLNKTSYVYDDFDQVTSLVRPDGSTQRTARDKTGNVTGQTDGLGKTTSYAYDALNRLSSEADPLGRRRTFGYDAADNQTSITDAAARTTTSSYDAAGQLTQVAYSSAGTPGVSCAYDSLGRRTSMTDGSGQSTYAYDSLGRLTQHRNGAGQTVGYGYDLAGQKTSIAYPSALGGGGGTVARVHDAAGRLTSVADWRGNVTRFGYDPDSHPISQTYPNAATASRVYDRAGRVTSIVHSSPVAGQFLNLAYTRDAAGRLRTEGSKGFNYDANDRLSSQTSAPNVSYGYTSADNVAAVTLNATGEFRDLDYDAAGQLATMTTTVPTGDQDPSTGEDITTTTTTSYGYDAHGNRTADSSKPGPYVYDQANRLTAHQSSTYSYDGDGLRTTKTTAAGTRVHVWDITAPIPEMIGDANTAYITGPDGLPIQQITAAGTVHYYHQDQLGSTRALSTSTGTVAATASYDAYGNVATSTGTTTTPFGFAGQYTDPETGLQYLRARYYDPETQNFLTRDPLAAQTRAPYNYADNNPTNNTDPTGEAACIAILVGKAAGFGVAAGFGWGLGELWDTWNRDDNISRTKDDGFSGRVGGDACPALRRMPCKTRGSWPQPVPRNLRGSRWSPALCSSSASPSRQGRRFAARCARPWRAALDSSGFASLPDRSSSAAAEPMTSWGIPTGVQLPESRQEIQGTVSRSPAAAHPGRAERPSCPARRSDEGPWLHPQSERRAG